MREATKELKAKFNEVFEAIRKNFYLFERIYEMKEDERLEGETEGQNGWFRHKYQNFDFDWYENGDDCEPKDWMFVLEGYGVDIHDPQRHYVSFDEFFELKEIIDEQIVLEKLRRD